MNMKFMGGMILTLGFLAIFGFCVFGFLASYEVGELSKRLPWQLGYGAGGAGCLLAIISLWRRIIARRKQTRHRD
jgi:hypothetical protein